MKKTLLISLALLAFNFILQAQTRTIDWSTESILSPDSMLSTTTGTSFNLNIVMKNNGADTAHVGDSVLFSFFVTNTAGTQTVLAYPSTTSLAVSILKREVLPGDTIQIAIPLATTLVVSTSTMVRIAVSSVLINRPNINIETSTTNANNQKEKQIIWYNKDRNGVGFDELTSNNAISVYPNPAVNEIVFETAKANKSSLSIFDIHGKLIQVSEIHESQNKINLETFNSGIYFYQIADDKNETVTSGKFVVAK